jgi:hypothetical protein
LFSSIDKKNKIRFLNREGSVCYGNIFFRF